MRGVMPMSVQSLGGLEVAKMGRTKGQRRRANERQRKQAERLFAETMGPMTEAVTDFMDKVESNVRPMPPEQQEAWERAPGHTVDYNECPGLNTEVLAHMAKAAGDSRTTEAKTIIGELKLKYPAYWGRRGRAGTIARLESKSGNPLSERTVQNYFKMTRK
jgi:hypothetical protein